MFRRSAGDAADQPFIENARGLRVPRLGLGTWELRDKACQKMVEQAIQLGYRHIDTAQQYENEDAIGAAIRASGATDTFVVTKVHRTRNGEVRAALEDSRKALGVDTIDMALIHWPDDWDGMTTTMSELAKAKDDGLCRHVGVSNFSIEQLDAVIDLAPIEMIQSKCNVQLGQPALRSWAQSHDVLFTAYGPLARGRVFKDADFLGAIGSADPAAAALGWLLSRPGVAAIPKSGRKKNLKANWEARNVSLTPAQLSAIDAIPGTSLDE